MNESENLEPQTAAENPEFAPEYLREAVRLAELRMSEHSRLQIGNERRAALLITFCVVLMGYLLGGDWTGWWGMKCLPFLFLTAAAMQGIWILEPTEFGLQGMHPAVSAIYKDNGDKLPEYIQKIYGEKIGKNGRALTLQSKYLERARIWLYWGLLGTIVVALSDMVAMHFG